MPALTVVFENVPTVPDGVGLPTPQESGRRRLLEGARLGDVLVFLDACPIWADEC